MMWIEPAHSKSRVDKAGSILAAAEGGGSADFGPLFDATRLDEARRVVGNWRSAHAFPLNTLQNGLRQHIGKVKISATVSQRLKRIPSTVAKLRRFRNMKLSRMQDMGGCRGVVATVDQVRKLQQCYRRSGAKHQPVNGRDYIEKPKESGYRSVHLVYRYQSASNQVYNGLLIEVQLRTRLQHAWATAVETAGAFLGQALKSSEGERDWLRFFALVGSAFAMDEGCAGVPGTPPDPKVLEHETRMLARQLEVAAKLTEYAKLLKVITDDELAKRHHFFLLERRPDRRRIYVTGYKRGELAKSTDAYFRAEERVKDINGAEVVLVSTDSVAALRRAYPSYYLDTRLFLQEKKRVVGE